MLVFAITTLLPANVAYLILGPFAPPEQGASLLRAFAGASVPRVTVVLRKAYGKGPLAVVAIGLGISLAVEVVQFTGNFGAVTGDIAGDRLS